MTHCPYRFKTDAGNRCEIVAVLASVSTSEAVIRDDACRACVKETAQPNYVTASIAIKTVRHLRPESVDMTLLELRQYLRQPPPIPGPGTELVKLISRFGLLKSTDCDCEGHAQKMNKHGSEWCQRNIETIVGWLYDEARKRGLFFSAFLARRLIRKAIRRADKKQASIENRCLTIDVSATDRDIAKSETA